MLHSHSIFSILDSVAKPKNIAQRCAKLDISTCALTDHGNVSGSLRIIKSLKEKNIKPILGCEFYVSFTDAKIKTSENRKLHHLILLAKNLQGWKELIALVSDANHPDHFYYKPRLSLEQIGERISGKNIIALVGHLGSILTPYLLDNPDWYKQGETQCRRLQDIFGIDNFFLEVQRIDISVNPLAKIMSEVVRELSVKTGIMAVATPDSHYCEREDAIDQRTILCSKLQTTLRNINNKLVNEEDVSLGQFFKSNNYHIPSYDEMREVNTEEELDNALLVANMCEEYSITSPPKLPKFPTPNGEPSLDYLRQLCREGWQRLEPKLEQVMKSNGLLRSDYGNRFKKEFSTIEKFDLLADYFLMVKDIIDYAHINNSLTGAARGSAAGSLILYLLGVTRVDPLQYDLLWERFYNEGRNTIDNISLPDVDMDFERNFRPQILKHIRDTYGIDKVAQIITFGRMQGRSALKDVLRVYESCSFEEMNRITEFIPDEAKIIDELQEMREASPDGEASILEWALENNGKQLENWVRLDKSRESGKIEIVGDLGKRFAQAMRLEGTLRSSGKHAAGVVIGYTQLRDICPLAYDKKAESEDAALIVAFEKDDLEKIGCVKMDILSVSMLDRIHTIQDLVNK